MKRQSIKPPRSGEHSLCFVTLSKLLAVALVCLFVRTAQASLPSGVDHSDLTSIAAAPNGGFWIQVDGDVDNSENGGSRTIAINGAPQYANIPHRGSIASVPGILVSGYFVVTDTGQIFARGHLSVLCGGNLSSCSGFPSNPKGYETIVAAAATPDGDGLWAVGRDGRVWTAGSAVSYGDVTNDSSIPTGIAATPSGLGYYIVLADGGVYTFGDAVFYGSTGGNKPGGHDATGLAVSLDLNGHVVGYWMVFDDGGVFTFGDAPFLGSTGGNDGGSPVTGIAWGRDSRFPYSYGLSYAWVHYSGQQGISEMLPRVVISSSENSLVWGVPAPLREPGTPIQLMAYNNNPPCAYRAESCAQRWDVWPTTQDSSIVQLVNVYSGQCADVAEAANRPYLIQFSCKGDTEGWDNQRFEITTYPDGTVDFTPLNNPEYVVVPGIDSGLGLGSGAYGNWVLTNSP